MLYLDTLAWHKYWVRINPCTGSCLDSLNKCKKVETVQYQYQDKNSFRVLHQVKWGLGAGLPVRHLAAAASRRTDCRRHHLRLTNNASQSNWIIFFVLFVKRVCLSNLLGWPHVLGASTADVIEGTRDFTHCIDTHVTRYTGPSLHSTIYFLPSFTPYQQTIYRQQFLYCIKYLSTFKFSNYSNIFHIFCSSTACMYILHQPSKTFYNQSLYGANGNVWAGCRSGRVAPIVDSAIITRTKKNANI